MKYYKISWASISCSQNNRNEEEVPKKDTITQKYQIKQLPKIFVLPHLRKCDETHVQKKVEREFPIPPITTKRKSQPKTLKLKGIVKNIYVMILVDFRSTHNCIDINVGKQLNHFLYPTKDLTVMVINGKNFKGVGRCYKSLVHIQ